MGGLCHGQHFLWPKCVLFVKIHQLLFEDKSVLLDPGRSGCGMRKHGLFGLRHADQHMSSLPRNWDMLKRWRSLVWQQRVLRFCASVQLSRHKPLLPDGDSSSGSLWGHGLLDLQDDFGLHQDMSDRADT
jgi:hypothetical protein